MNGDNTPKNTDTCQGDSGGPLVFNLGQPAAPLNGSASDDRLVGVTSW
jgi:secreted trypsin-like serine protease